MLLVPVAAPPFSPAPGAESSMACDLLRSLGGLGPALSQLHVALVGDIGGIHLACRLREASRVDWPTAQCRDWDRGTSGPVRCLWPGVTGPPVAPCSWRPREAAWPQEGLSIPARPLWEPRLWGSSVRRDRRPLAQPVAVERRSFMNGPVWPCLAPSWAADPPAAGRAPAGRGPLSPRASSCFFSYISGAES